MRRILFRVFLVAAFLAAVVGVGWYLYGGIWRNRFEARVAALRAAGQPTTFEDLATPPIPDEENGATLLKEANRVLDERTRAPGNAEDLLHKPDRSAEEQAAVVAYLGSLSPYFDLLSRVPERPGWRLDLDWKAGIAMDVDLYRQLFDARRHLIARVTVDSEEAGRTERAARAATLFLALGTKCRGPFLIGHFVAESVASESIEVLRTAMRQPGFDAATFRKIVDPALARSIPERGPPRSAFVQERTFGIGAVRAIAAGAAYYGEPSIRQYRRPFFYRGADRFLDVVEQALARCETSPEDAIAVAAELDAEPDVEDPYFGNCERTYSRTFLVYTDIVARRRLARVVMALLEHRQREGTWPKDLAVLGEMPTDPHSGGPFLYESTEHGCKVRAAKEGTPEDRRLRYLAWTLEDDQIPAMAR